MRSAAGRVAWHRVSRRIRPAPQRRQTRFELLGAISFSHFLNDMIQSLIVAIYPLLKGEFHLSFVQIGAITLTYQVCASVLQPDRRHLYRQASATPFAERRHGLHAGRHRDTGLRAAITRACWPRRPWSAPAPRYFIPSPRASRAWPRAAATAWRNRYFRSAAMPGSAMGPLLAAWIIIPHGQRSLAWFAFAAILAIVVLGNVSGWYKRQHIDRPGPRQRPPPARCRGAGSLVHSVLVLLIFSKYFYLASISSYYSFYLIEKFPSRCARRKCTCSVFLLAMALGALLGGPMGDRIGRKRVIWFSILGVAPFTPDPALRRFEWAGNLDVHHRLHTVLGFLGDRGIRPGAHARQSRRRVGTVLRFRFRHGRHRRRRVGRPCRPARHRIRVSDLRLSCRCSGWWRHSCPTSSTKEPSGPNSGARFAMKLSIDRAAGAEAPSLQENA